jgi:uncharacterized protein YbjT (DUF2867 family)
MNILVTGGTGHLGRPVVARLQQAGHHVRVLARRPGDDPGVEWFRGDLATGQGIEEAVAGADVVVHAATNSPAARRGAFRPRDFVRSPADVDVEGTRTLLAAAGRSDVRHVVHVSIVGLEAMSRLPYARVKLAAEEEVRRSPVPWTIARASAFYWLMERMLDGMTRRRLVVLPAGVVSEPVDAGEFADYVVDLATGEPRGVAQDFVGPAELSMEELAEQYLSARGRRRRVWPVPVPRVIRAALGSHTSPTARRGATTWGQWLSRAA